MISAKNVNLHKHANLGRRLGLKQIPAERLGLVYELPGRHRSSRGTRVDRASGRRRSRCRTAYSAIVQIALHGDVGRGAQGTKDAEDFVLFDQPARHIVQLSSAGFVSVIQTEKVDLSAIDAALLVDRHPVSTPPSPARSFRVPN